MKGKVLKRIRRFSGREKVLLIIGAALLAVSGLRLMVVDYAQWMAADREVQLQQSVRDARWLKAKRAALTCLSQQNNGSSAINEDISVLNPPATLTIASVIRKENTLFLTAHFREHAQLLEWLLHIEASSPLRVTMLNLSDAMDKADIMLSEVDCYDL